MMKRALLVMGMMAVAPSLFAMEAVLIYQGDNHWVAQADNKPLLKVIAEAKKGTRHFTVKMPEDDRPLAIERLDVLTGILSKQAKGAVVIEEIKGAAKANTLVIGAGK